MSDQELVERLTAQARRNLGCKKNWVTPEDLLRLCELASLTSATAPATYLGAENYWPEYCKLRNVMEGSPLAGWWGYDWAEFVSDKRAAALTSATEGERDVDIPFCDAPCGHSSQYCYSENGGRQIICLLCEHSERATAGVGAESEVCREVREIMETYREQESEGRVDTPSGLEHMGDVWRLFRKWDDMLARAESPSTEDMLKTGRTYNAASQPEER